VSVPEVPYRGIHPFRYDDHPIFFAREEETVELAGLVSVYRGVLLYGDSGAGKSSLLNAGLMPLLIERGYAPVRVRVQPREDAELVIEPRWAPDPPGSSPAATNGAAEKDPAARMTLAVSGFREYLAGLVDGRRPFVIFDQFEELVTLFDTPPAQELQRRLTALIAELLHGSLRVKLLLAFRDDYLGKLKELLADCPELVDQALRLAPPSVDALPTIISGPFDRHPDHFEHPLPPGVREKLIDALADRFGAGEVSLSEVQTVCLRLWQSDTPDALLEQRGVQGLLEDYLGEAIDQMPQQLQDAAIALLAQMITDAGTRNVISAADLFQRVREREGRQTPAVLEQALERLSQSRLVRRERRRDLDLYEITTEFLVPWISHRREEHRRRRERRRLTLVGAIAAALVLLAAGVAALAIWALAQRQHARTAAAHARTEATNARALALSADATSAAGASPSAALVLSLAALAPYRAGPSSPAIATTTMARWLENARSQGLTGVLQGTTNSAYSVAFSPDGRTLAAGTFDGRVLLWDKANHTLIASLSAGPGNKVSGVAFSPDGRTLAAGTDKGTLLWDTANQTLIVGVSTDPDEGVESVAFSPDGRTLAAGTSFGRVLLWDPVKQTQIASLSAGTVAVESVAFSPDGRTLAASTDKARVLLWDSANLTRRGSLSAPQKYPADNSVYDIAFSRDGRTLAAATSNGPVLLWDIAHRARIGSLSPGTGTAAYGVAFSPVGRTLAVGTDNGKLLLWDPVKNTRTASRSAGTGNAIFSVAFSPDGRTLAAATDNGPVLLWDTADHAQTTSLPTGTGDTGNTHNDVAFSPDGRTVAAASTLEGRVVLWDATRNTELGSLSAGRYASVKSVAFSPDGRTLAGGADKGKLVLWDPVKRTQLASVSAGPPIFTVAFSPDGRTVAAGTANGTVLLWSPADHTQLRTLSTGTKDAVNGVAFSPDGRTLAAGTQDGAVLLWSAANHTRLASLSAGTKNPVNGVAFSPDGRTLAAGTENKGTLLWNAVTHTQLASPPTSSTTVNRVTSVAFNPDGRTLAAGAGRTVLLFDAGNYAQLASVSAGDGITGAAFSPDGRTLAVGTAGVRLMHGEVWRSFAALQDEICEIVPGGLSRAAWRTYAPGLTYENDCHKR